MIAWCPKCEKFTEQEILFDEFEVGTLTPFEFPTKCNVCQKEIRPTKDAPDLGESSASDSESNPAPKRVI